MIQTFYVNEERIDCTGVHPCLAKESRWGAALDHLLSDVLVYIGARAQEAPEAILRHVARERVDL